MELLDLCNSNQDSLMILLDGISGTGKSILTMELLYNGHVETSLRFTKNF